LPISQRQVSGSTVIPKIGFLSTKSIVKIVNPSFEAFPMFALRVLKLSPLGILALSALMPFAPSFTTKASAACVMVDMNVMVAVHGSKNPSHQNNDATMDANENCYSGASVTKNTNVGVAPGDVYQDRKSHSSINSQAPEGSDLPGMSGPAIKIPVDIRIDVQNPALDPDFMQSRRIW
jgi:hypothetical protein